MKHTFLLDENILYYAIKGVDEQENEDLTALNLVRLILKNCHSIVYDLELCRRYSSHLKKLKAVKKFIPLGTELITKSLLYNTEKAKIKYEEAPTISEENNLPIKDIPVVRAAVYCGAKILVSGDENLRNIINSKFSHTGMLAFSPLEALRYARET